MPEEATEEVTEEIAEEPAEGGAPADEAASPETDEVILDGITFEPAPKAEKAKAAAKPEEEEKPAAEPDGIESRMAELEKNYKSASDHIKDLQKALHQTRQENRQLKEGKSPQKTEEEFLTDEQVKAILEEHGNDWNTVLRVINHQAAKAAAKAEGKVLNDVQVKEVQQRLNSFLEAEWPDVVKEDSEIRPHLDKTKAELGIEGNPYADFLAAGAHFLTNWRKMADSIVKQTEERVRKEALGEKAEGARKATVAKTSLAGKGAADKTKAAPAVPANVDAIAKQMGMTANQKKIYTQLIGKRGGMGAQMGA
jgi:hypothetical protein